MADDFSKTLNETLVDTFRTILKVEEHSLRKTGGIDLSISEMHFLEAVGKSEDSGRTISDIAQHLGITLSSVTIAVNKLAKKGYVDKLKGESDGRTVFVKLTKKGRRADAVHKYFHENMVRNISSDFTAEEREIFLKGLLRLNVFFKQKLPGEDQK